MKNIKFKVMAIFLITILVFASFSSAINNMDVENQEELLEEIVSQLEALDASHGDVVNQKNKIIKNIRGLEDTVRSIEGEIQGLNGDIDNNKIQIGLAIMELDAAIVVLKDTNELLEDRIRVMYKNGTVGYFEVMLDSKSFEDLLVRIEMLKKIVTSDTKLIDQLEKDKIVVDEKKANLEGEQVKLVNLQSEKSAKQSELKTKISELQVKKNNLLTDIAALEIQIDETNADAEKVKQIIKDMKLMETYVGGVMSWPVPGQGRVTSDFGMRIHPILNVNKLHTGVDVSCDVGTPVVAAQEGKVIWSNWLGGYGKAIMIDHGGGIVTLYAHNSDLIAKKGDTVSKGQRIALSGNTGNSTGPHVHFEVRVNGEFVDPMDGWIRPATEF